MTKLVRLAAILLCLSFTVLLVVPAFASTQASALASAPVSAPCGCGKVVQVFMRGFGRAQSENDLTTDHTQSPEYEFFYDFRIDPFEAAKLLDSYIEDLCRVTGHGKIALTGSSQGGAVVTTYLYEYGTRRVETLILINGAHLGTTLVGEAATGRFALSGSAFLNFIEQLDEESQALSSVTKLLRKTPLERFYAPMNWLRAGTVNAGREETVLALFRFMPILLYFLPGSYYPQVRPLLARHARDAGMLAKTDRYFAEIQPQVPRMLKDAKKAGVRVAVIATYGNAPIPLTLDVSYQGDLIMDTVYESVGATVPKIGQTLPQSDSRYRSADGLVDASTCAVPDQTWFVKDGPHSLKPAYELRQWIIHCEAVPTVWENPLYPQYVRYTSEDGKVAAIAN